MNLDRGILRVHPELALGLLFVAATLLIAGCGGGSVATPVISTPTPVTPTAANIQGQWQVIAQSTNGGTGVLIETNLAQSGTNVTAAKSSVVLIQGVPGTYTGLGGECDHGALGDDSIQATVSGQTLSFTLTEAGSLGTGTSTGTATISSDGTQITSGTYTTTAACGFVADSGTVTGAVIKPFSGTFAGMLANGPTTDAVTVTISQSGYNLSVTGTDNGAPFTLSGTVVGATFDVTGTIGGRSVEYVGLYETSANDFRVYDTAFNPLGVLNAQTSAPPPTPIAVSVSPSTVSIQVNQQANFTATVMNDSTNKGVTWALSGTGCSAATCGTLSAASSASGASITYTAPALVPPGTVALTATSATDATKSATATITITAAPLAIVVTVSPMTASVATGGATQSFAATVQNDSQNKGVNWTVSGATCSGAACGTVSPTSSASGAAVTYTSPATAGTVTLTATSVSNNSVSAAATITLTAPSATGPVNLGAGNAPSTVVDSNGVVDVAWVTPAGIVFAQSQDNGVTFSSPKLVVPASAGPVSIQVDAQNDIVIFTGAMLARSTDGGKTFSNVAVPQQISSRSLLLVQSSGVLDLVYTASDDNGVDPDNSVHESRSTDGGKTFVNDQVLWTAAINSNDVLEIRGATGPQGQVYLTWAEQSDLACEVFFIASLDGVNFQPVTMLTNTDVCNINPMLVVDTGGNLNLAWEDGSLEFTRSTDQGQTFSAPKPGPSVGIRFTQQFVVGPNGEIDLVFDGMLNSTTDQVYFTQSLDHGATWSTPVNLSLPSPVQNFAGARSPYVGVDTSGKITVAWQDDTNGKFSGDNDIYIRTSTDGVTFSSPMDVSNTTDQIEVNPIIVETPKGLRYMTWYDMNGKQSNPVLSVFFYAVQ